jgi:replicative DNA helicase
VIVNGHQGLAMDLDIAVVLLSQMSRKADEHYGRPTMTHLRDSGAIEAAADQIALLFTDHAHPMSKRHRDSRGTASSRSSRTATGRRAWCRCSSWASTSRSATG